MKYGLLEILAKVSLVIFSFLILYYFAQGITTKVWEGDSVAYHVPISNLILTGKIFNPGAGKYLPPVDKYRLYQPGSAEIILSIFQLAKIPLNLFDVVGILFFFYSMYLLARSYELSKYFSLLFATSTATLHTVMRWVLSQTIDVWLAAFFALSIVLLRKPNKSYKYFLVLGATLGMLFGSKYTGPAYTVFLLILFGQQALKLLNFRRLLTFIIPFSILGPSWYIRNYFLTGDPYFPQSIPFFKGIPYGVLDQAVWRMFIEFKGGPVIWFHAFISEYTVWSLVILAVPFLYFWTKKKVSRDLSKEILKLSILSILSFVVYLFLPSGPTPSLITSVFRYTYPVFIPLILCVFIYAQRFKVEKILAVVAVTNMIILPELSYHPKILIALVPIALIIFYPSKVQEFYNHISKIENFYKLIQKRYSHYRV